MNVVNLERVKTSERPIARYRQVITTDENGEVISDVSALIRKANGGGFVLSYTAKMCEFLEKTTQGSIVRVFVYIAHHQNYGKDGVFGYRTTRSYLSKVLRMNRKTVYDALEYLIANFLVVENRIDGSPEFMVNPAYVTVGADKKIREREWNKRFEWYLKAHPSK